MLHYLCWISGSVEVYGKSKMEMETVTCLLHIWFILHTLDILASQSVEQLYWALLRVLISDWNQALMDLSKVKAKICQISAGAAKSLSHSCLGLSPFHHQGREGSLRQLCNFQTIVSLLIEESGNNNETIGSDKVTFATFAFHFWNLDFTVSSNEIIISSDEVRVWPWSGRCTWDVPAICNGQAASKRPAI